MLSYARGLQFPLREQNIYEALKEKVTLSPNHEALVVPHQQKRFTFSQLHDEVERVARGIVGLGLQGGDRVGVWAANCAEWIFLQLACARTGIVLVNVNPAYRSNDLAHILRKSRMRVLFMHSKDARADYRTILGEACKDHNLDPVHTVCLDEKEWAELVAGQARIPEVSILPSDVVNIQYTSGTTGYAKGVLLTHRSVLNNANLVAESMGLRTEDRVVNPFPLYHCGG